MNIVLSFVRIWMAWVLPRPRLVLGLAILSAVASFAVAAKYLDVETDQLELISQNHPLIAPTDELQRFNFGSRTVFTVVVQTPTPEAGVGFVKALASRVSADKTYFEEIIHRVDPALFKSWALLYPDREDLVELRSNLDGRAELIDGLAASPDVLTLLRLVNKEMASRMVGELFTGFLDEKQGEESEEPMDLGFLIATLEGLQGQLSGKAEYVPPWSSLFGGEGFDLEQQGYFWEGDKRYLLAFVVPKKMGDDLNRTGEPQERLRDIIKEVGGSFPGVTAGVTGQEALNNDEMSTVIEDMAVATWLSFSAVLVLVVLFFRGWRRPAIELTALGISLCWTFGWTTLFLGHLNILSVVFAPLLCGMGDDYGIHWLSRYEEEERKRGNATPRELSWIVAECSGPGIFLAGLSAAFSLLPLVLTGFRGLMELGLITGVGLLLTLLSVFTVVPALSVLMAGKKKPRPGKESDTERDFLRLTPRSGRIILAVIALISLAALWSAMRVRFDLNPLKLQAKNAESVQWENILVEHSSRSLLSAAAFAPSLEELDRKAEAFRKLPSVLEVETLPGLLPRDQEEKLPILESIRSRLPELSASQPDCGREYAEDLSEVLGRIGFKMRDDQAREWGAEKPVVEQMTRVRTLADEIVRLLESPDGDRLGRLEAYCRKFRADIASTWSYLKAGSSPMRIEDIPQTLKDQFYRDGTYLARIYPKESIWEGEALDRFVREIQTVDEWVVGDPVSLYVFASNFKRACILASVYSVAAIAILLILSFRNIGFTLMAMLPLIVGATWTLGVMGFFGVDFNLANSMFMPLVVGVGVEYGVIILHRWSAGGMRPGRLPFSVAKGVVLAALTTNAAYGTLMISHHRGIFSLGFVTWVGSLCMMVTAVVLLPAILVEMKPPKPIYWKEKCK